MVPEKQCQANIIFVILVHFLPFYHLPPPPSPNPKNPKDQNFEKKKQKKKEKMPGDIILLYIHVYHK